MSQQLDFLAQKGQLEEIIVAAGHQLVFYSKFHCELNYIENFWVQPKDIAGHIVIIHRKDCKELLCYVLILSCSQLFTDMQGRHFAIWMHIKKFE
ncbi:601_t:CDS:1, partial [Cetraspora pellucida]